MKRFFLLLALASGIATSTQAQITATAETQTTEDPNAKYLVPIPLEENGKVYLERDLTLPKGTNKEETFEKMKDWVDRCMKDPRISSNVELDPEAPKTISRAVTQEMVFSSNFISLDKCQISYVLELSLKGDQMILKMRRITYHYDGDNPDRKMQHLAAEDYIADSVCLNKAGTKIYKNYRKFRVKTIDLIDEYKSSLKMAFWIK